MNTISDPSERYIASMSAVFVLIAVRVWQQYDRAVTEKPFDSGQRP